VPYRSPGGALYRFPGPRPSDNGSHVDAFEGFARSFLLAAFRIPLAEPGRADQLADRYAAGIAAGTAGREAWPRLSGLTQPLVEASAVALGLLQTMPSVWPRLGEAARQRLVDYLLDARDAPRPTGNWMWFQIVIELFLAAAGGLCDTAAIDERLDALLALRRPGGMWSDGGGARYDYYSSWAFSFYSAFWARHDGARRPSVADILYCQALEQRAIVRSLTDEDGRPVLLGRSLIYRAAVSAGLWSPALFPGTGDSEAGWVATVATATLDQVMAGGAADSGVLSLGWGREFAPMAQPYSGPASPYWMSKAFAGLLLPATHPIWAEGSSPPPLAEIAAPGWLLAPGGGIVRLHNHGTWRTEQERDPHSRRFVDDPFYSRLAYSSVTAPTIDGALKDGDGEPSVPDNSLVFDDGCPATVRADVTLIYLGPEAAASTWTPRSRRRDWPPVTTRTLAHGADEVRIHTFELQAPATVTATGYTLSSPEPLAVDVSEQIASVSDGAWKSSVAPLGAVDLRPANGRSSGGDSEGGGDGALTGSAAGA